MKRFLKLAIFYVLPALLGTMSTPPWAAESAADSVAASDPYVRAVPPGQPNSAAFMRLRNDGASDHALVSAESSASRIVELHTHVEEDGVMKMRQIEKIDIPARGDALLKPGGLHVMLIDLNEELQEGANVSITLIFEDGSRNEIQAPVRKLKMKMDKHKGHE